MKTEPIIDEYCKILFNRVKKNLRRLNQWINKEGISCYRIYDRDIPEIPLSIDKYENNLHVSIYKKASKIDNIDVALKLVHPIAGHLGIQKERVFIKPRARQTHHSQYEKVSTKAFRVVIGESGHRFIVNLSDYTDTGLFLDHRRTRQLIEKMAYGKHFLNLFAYTGSFTVYAAKGRALSTTTVDLSNTYLNWAAENLAINNIQSSHHHLIRADVNEFLTNEKYHTKHWDLVVVDAPTISRSKQMKAKFDIQNDHGRIINQVLSISNPKATIFFSTNYRKFKLDEETINAASIEDITESTHPFDFRDPNIHRCYRLTKR